jgi:hypothetical protein
MQQWYQCPNCGAQVASGMRFCGTCGMQLNWPTQLTPLPSVYQQFQQPRRESKKTSPSLIGCLALIAIMFLVGGAIYALQGPSSITETSSEYVQQYENRQPPVQTAKGKMVHLSNNPNAKDVSFAELKSFIRADTTDEGLYLPGSRDCVDFAEQLHNNAEQARIKAAFVSVNFVGEEIGHALDAFNTTDMDLVYIDCTGMTFYSKLKSIIQGDNNKLQNDAVAYVEKDKQYGCISIDKAELLDYGFYIEYTQDCQQLDVMIDDFNNDYDAYERGLGGRTTLYEPEYSKFTA